MIIALNKITKSSKEWSFGTFYEFEGINTNFRGESLNRGLNRNVTLGETKNGNKKVVYTPKPDGKLYIMAPLLNEKNSNGLIIMGYESGGKINRDCLSDYGSGLDWNDIHNSPIFNRNKILKCEFDKVYLYDPEKDMHFTVDNQGKVKQYTLDDISKSKDPIFDHIIISDDKSRFAEKQLTKYDPMFHEANMEYFKNGGRLISPLYFDDRQRKELNMILRSLPEDRLNALLKDKEGGRDSWSIDKLNGYGILARLGNLDIVNENKNLFPEKEYLKGMFATNPYENNRSVKQEKAKQICDFFCKNKDNIIGFYNEVGFHDDTGNRAKNSMLRALAHPDSLDVIKNSKDIQDNVKDILHGIAKNVDELSRVDFHRYYGDYSDYDHKGDIYDIYFAANEIDPKTCDEDIVTRYLTLKTNWMSNEIYPDVKERVEKDGVPYWTEKLLEFSEEQGGLYNKHFNCSKQTDDLIANDLYDKIKIKPTKEEIYLVLDNSVKKGNDIYSYKESSFYTKDNDSVETSLSKERSLLLDKLDEIEEGGAEKYRQHQQTITVPTYVSSQNTADAISSQQKAIDSGATGAISYALHSDQDSKEIRQDVVEESPDRIDDIPELAEKYAEEDTISEREDLAPVDYEKNDRYAETDTIEEREDLKATDYLEESPDETIDRILRQHEEKVKDGAPISSKSEKEIDDEDEGIRTRIYYNS